jgi:DNA-binding PadR family transcriptional regulator
MRARQGEISASTAVLGLLIDEPDCVAGLTRRLAVQFPQARFGRNTAYKAMPTLARQGLVSVVERGRHRSLDRYAATRDGRQSFRESLRAASAVVPVLRDALRARLEHVGDETELREVIAAIRGQEEACLEEYATARRRFLEHRRARSLGAAGADGLRETVDRALMIDEAVLWGTRARRLQRLRESLQFGVSQDDADEGFASHD